MSTTNKTVRFALTRGGVWGEWTTHTNKTVRFALTKDGLWWESTSGTAAPRPPRWWNVIAATTSLLRLLGIAPFIHQLMN